MSTDATTKDRILDAAETLYAANGFGGTSLRTIMKAAGANMAAVHYHFGSRAALVGAVISRRAEPINRERIAGLDRVEAAHADGPLPLDDILEAFFLPVFRMLEDTGQAAFPHLMNRLMMDPDAELRGVIGRVFAEVAQRFMAAFRRSLPELSEDAIFWRVHFMLGAMVFSLTVPRAHAIDTTAHFSSALPLHVKNEFLQFASAGMRAPLAGERS